MLTMSAYMQATAPDSVGVNSPETIPPMMINGMMIASMPSRTAIILSFQL